MLRFVTEQGNNLCHMPEMERFRPVELQVFNDVSDYVELEDASPRVGKQRNQRWTPWSLTNSLRNLQRRALESRQREIEHVGSSSQPIEREPLFNY